MAAQPNSLGLPLARFENLFAQSLAIAFGIGWSGRSMQPPLAERQIVAHNLGSSGFEGFRDRNQHWSIAIRSGAVCKDQEIHE